MMSAPYSHFFRGDGPLDIPAGSYQVRTAAKLMSQIQQLTDSENTLGIGQSTPIHLLRETEHELVLARQKLEQANRLRAEFLAKLSHELRTPMTAIVGMTDLMLLGDVSAEQREYLGTVRDAADNLMLLLAEVCDYVRVEAGMLEFEWTGFRLRALVEEAIRPLAVQAHAKGLELVVSIDSEVPDLLVADPHRIVQIVSNLVDASIRLTRSGEVVLEIDRGPESDNEVTLKLLIRDTGMGIALEDHKRVLLPFAASDTGLRYRYPLGAMGLPLAASLIAALGGQLQLRSERGAGTCFEASIRLLKQNPVAAETDADSASLPTSPLSGLEAIVVEPNAASRRLLAAILARQGLEVAGFGNLDAAAAEPAATAARPAVLLIDSALALDSPTSLKSFCSQRDPRPVVLLLLRSNEDSLDTEQCEALGVTATLHKPIFERELLETLLASIHGANGKARSSAAQRDRTPVPPAGPHRATCEIGAAIARLGGDAELYKELVQCFLDDSSGLIPRIQRSVVQRQADELHRAAHSLKGLAASCGATGVADAAARLERLGRDKELDTVDEAHAALDQALALARQELAMYYSGG